MKPRRSPLPWTGLAPFHVIGPFECSILNMTNLDNAQQDLPS
jgi:hypothetical protein